MERFCIEEINDSVTPCVRFERICRNSAQRKPTIDLRRVSRGGEPPARFPLDKTFPRKVLSPLLRSLKEKVFRRLRTAAQVNCRLVFRLCSRGIIKTSHKGSLRFRHATRGVSPHTPPPLKRRAKLLFPLNFPFERICKNSARSKPTIYHRVAATGSRGFAEIPYKVNQRFTVA